MAFCEIQIQPPASLTREEILGRGTVYFFFLDDGRIVRKHGWDDEDEDDVRDTKTLSAEAEEGRDMMDVYKSCIKRKNMRGGLDTHTGRVHKRREEEERAEDRKWHDLERQEW